ncbi:MAG: DUF2953 domain-containing protein [Sarcina sp.]
MIFAIIICILLLILFVHIKIKLKVEYINNNLHVYVYKFEVPLKKKKKLNIKKSEIKRNKKISKLKTVLSKIKLKPLKLLNLLISNKYKPKLVINNFVQYSLEDAALTAEVFGGINILFSTINSIINLFLNFKFNLSIEPTFSNTTYFNIKVEGILSINLAQIIFILFLFLKSLSIKGGNPEGESYGK